MNHIEQLSFDEILVAYDDDSQSYYCIWRPLTCVGLGKTKSEALADLRAAAVFGIETIVDSKLREIEKTIDKGGECNGQSCMSRGHIVSK
jgi:predicted RNase H-like HicB family nuclease